MRVFIAGATGVLGWRLVDQFTDRGHDVVGLSRDDAGDDRVRKYGGEPHRGDMFEPATLTAGADGADVVIHAATAIPTPDGSGSWALNDRIRREGTRNLTAAAAEVNADRYLQQSVVMVARQPDGSAFDEDDPVHPAPNLESAVDGEEIAREAGQREGFGVSVLRGGWFYSADSAHVREFGERLLRRRLPAVGTGLLGRTEPALSWVHPDDAASAFVAAAEGDATGTYHVVDDEPASFAAFVRALADRLDAPRPRRVPAWLARLLADTDEVDFLSRPMPTSNDTFAATFDWAPAYPTFRDGLDELVAHWREEGFLVG